VVFAVLRVGSCVLPLVLDPLAQVLDAMLPCEAPVHHPVRPGVCTITFGVQSRVLFGQTPVFLFVPYLELLVLEPVLLVALLVIPIVVFGTVLVVGQRGYRNA
jgi:hypothetical protein